MLSLRSLFSRAAPTPTSIKQPGSDGLDILSADFLADSYPYYRYLRENEPVHRTRQGSWLLTSHAVQAEAFSNPALGNAPSHYAVIHPRNSQRYTSASVAQNILPFLDRPQQIRPRRLVGSVFRAALKDMTVDLDADAASLLRTNLKKGRLDLIADYAKPFSVRTISRLMGLPEEDAGQLQRWAKLFFFLFAPMPSQDARVETDAGLDAFRAYLQDVARGREGKGGADIVSRLLVAEDDEGRLSRDQVIDNCMLLFADGVENVDRGFANTIMALLQSPSEWLQLKLDPKLAAQAITEGLRFDPPAQMIGRVAREDLQIGGKHIKKDASVLLCVASANRDPEAYPNPDSFQIDRPGENLLTFGRGRHSCIGAPLVRQEMEAALRALITNSKKVEIDSSTLAWEPRLGHRWLKSLPAKITMK